jgi:hypothetical protein
MSSIQVPKIIPITPPFDIQMAASLDSETALVTYNLTVPIDLVAFSQGKSIIECIPQCIPEINSTTVTNYLETVTQRPL